jgi:CAP12/Pycsar effector protein, TIR domain
MVGRNKSFKQIRFPASLVSNIYERWTRIVDAEGPVLGLNEVILNDEERLTFDTFASWLNAYRRNPPACTLTNITQRGNSKFNYYFGPYGSSVELELPNVDIVNELMQIFEREAPNYRQNIVHETGLFQGRLGFDRAIIIREEGTEDFSNIHGLQEIRFPPGQIRAIFGEVIEILKKHFPEPTGRV